MHRACSSCVGGSRAVGAIDHSIGHVDGMTALPRSFAGGYLNLPSQGRKAGASYSGMPTLPPYPNADVLRRLLGAANVGFSRAPSFHSNPLLPSVGLDFGYFAVYPFPPSPTFCLFAAVCSSSGCDGSYQSKRWRPVISTVPKRCVPRRLRANSQQGGFPDSLVFGVGLAMPGWICLPDGIRMTARLEPPRTSSFSSSSFSSSSIPPPLHSAAPQHYLSRQCFPSSGTF